MRPPTANREVDTRQHPTRLGRSPRRTLTRAVGGILCTNNVTQDSGNACVATGHYWSRKKVFVEQATHATAMSLGVTGQAYRDGLATWSPEGIPMSGSASEHLTKDHHRTSQRPQETENQNVCHSPHPHNRSGQWRQTSLGIVGQPRQSPRRYFSPAWPGNACIRRKPSHPRGDMKTIRVELHA